MNKMECPYTVNGCKSSQVGRMAKDDYVENRLCKTSDYTLCEEYKWIIANVARSQTRTYQTHNGGQTSVPIGN
jgi:hypothetical protein